MSQALWRDVNFGPSHANLTGSTGVGYTVFAPDGTAVVPRTTAGVQQFVSGTGVYGALVTVPDQFRGQLIWDSGETPDLILYAVDRFNYEENNSKVDQIDRNVQAVTGSLSLVGSTVDFIKHMTEGRWKIVNNQMVFYQSDNSTEVARFNLLDSTGNPTMTAVAERVRV